MKKIEFIEFKKKTSQVGTTEEAIANAEKIENLDTGLKAKHPFIKNKKIPIFVANFILMDYGTGAIFGCPAHDQRDFDFAKKYNLSIIPVVKSNNFKNVENQKRLIQEMEKFLIQSFLNDLTIAEAKKNYCMKLKNENWK